jgi:hypothetical protein
MNAAGALAFTPWGRWIRDLGGFPDGSHALYLLVIAVFVGLFGVGYLYAGLTGHLDPLFIAISAAGKLAFVALLTGFWLAGELSIRAPLAAVGDLFFGVLFVMWLLGRPARRPVD